MAYVAKPRVKSVASLALYRAIAQAVQANYARWESQPAARHFRTGELLEDHYPYQRQLDAVRTGEAVNIDVADLPKDVRRMGQGGRAIVRPDDSVSFVRTADIRFWMEETGLLYDHRRRTQYLRDDIPNS